MNSGIISTKLENTKCMLKDGASIALWFYCEKVDYAHADKQSRYQKLYQVLTTDCGFEVYLCNYSIYYRLF